MNAINWFEIPVINLDRALAFYQRTLGLTFKREVFGGTDMAIFPADERGAGGALVLDARRKPSADGVLVYLNARGKLDEILARLERAGSEIVLPKTDIGDPGFIAIFRDSEGNVVGLHASR